ncbi:MAG: di-trans,poly-cis-decaprenylcistransferase [Candidatus Andersenbacteria bacterium CG10_big_fil_rev_8_21_14_0_10_54_11]|uniref:Isoprenyl transferase n=1 Tax=Candidatus Andersenbacteria bacterium CG10_big_fil_rev_8_21_14_0_10_54_11 TaxID=1974485 RepID=A0A2M6WYY7_9BACT|nr:MAG: di-trans,poly-cis-decaprenylcistransferase [Candidatus Andersenbacteria bacterium CG10_big_fil_rev_8_21_14_0_10_54_11]
MSETIPRHVAIIPDGNRRWAAQQGLSAFRGHEIGIAAFQEAARQAADRGVDHLSLWGMSLDNLTKRSPREVAGLLRIFRREFAQLAENAEIHERQTRINVFGRWREKLPAVVRREIEKALRVTENYDRHHLNFFLAYNGTDEMLEAVRAIVREAPLRITAGTIKQHLFTRDLPPVDLIIRTGGEPHLSNGFMMWDAADAELYFTEKLWPEFTPETFDAALEDFTRRRRRRGK